MRGARNVVLPVRRFAPRCVSPKRTQSAQGLQLGVLALPAVPPHVAAPGPPAHDYQGVRGDHSEANNVPDARLPHGLERQALEIPHLEFAIFVPAADDNAQLGAEDAGRDAATVGVVDGPHVQKLSVVRMRHLDGVVQRRRDEDTATSVARSRGRSQIEEQSDELV